MGDPELMRAALDYTALRGELLLLDERREEIDRKSKRLDLKRAAVEKTLCSSVCSNDRSCAVRVGTLAVVIQYHSPTHTEISDMKLHGANPDA